MKVALYNLDEDIQELNDVSNQYEEIVERMEKIMTEEHTSPEVGKFKMPALEKKISE